MAGRAQRGWWSGVLVGAAVLGVAGWFAWQEWVVAPRLRAAELLAERAFEILPASAAAPDLALRGRDGKTFSVGDFKGQVVFVNFWATWCPPCRAEMPSMVQLGRELARTRPGKFRMVAISSDEGWPDIDRYFAQAFGGAPAELTVALDPQATAARAYYCLARGFCPDIKFPETYIVDKTGRIVAYVVADRNWSDPVAMRWLYRLIDG